MGAPPDFLLRFIGSTFFMRFSSRENRTRVYRKAQGSRKFGYAPVEMTKGRVVASLKTCYAGLDDHMLRAGCADPVSSLFLRVRWGALGYFGGRWNSIDLDRSLSQHRQVLTIR